LIFVAHPNKSNKGSGADALAGSVRVRDTFRTTIRVVERTADHKRMFQVDKDNMGASRDLYEISTDTVTRYNKAGEPVYTTVFKDFERASIQIPIETVAANNDRQLVSDKEITDPEKQKAKAEKVYNRIRTARSITYEKLVKSYQGGVGNYQKAADTILEAFEFFGYNPEQFEGLEIVARIVEN
jgi:hypothetical protein